MYLLPALAAGLVRCIYIDRLDKLSEGIGGQLRDGAVPLYPLNNLLYILCLLFLFMDLLLQTLDLGFEVFLFLGVVLAHHGEAFIVQPTGNIVLVNSDEKTVKLSDSLLGLCQMCFQTICFSTTARILRLVSLEYHSLNQFLMPAMSLSVLLGSMVTKWSLMAIYRTPY